MIGASDMEHNQYNTVYIYIYDMGLANHQYIRKFVVINDTETGIFVETKNCCLFVKTNYQ